MTTELAQRRTQLAWRFGMGALAAAGLAFMTLSIDARSLRPETPAGAVLPELARRADDVQRIIVTGADESYRIERTDDGWVMRDRGDYPVRADRVEALTQSLIALRYVRRMTADPDKLDRIGLGDPLSEGRGVLVQYEDMQGALLADIVLGIETDAGGIYVRRAGETQTWAAAGAAPAVRSLAEWLDLAPIVGLDGDFVRVDITPPEGRAYSLIPADPATPSAGFSFAPPLRGIAPRSTLELSDIAARITQLQPIDVSPAPAIQGPVQARLRATTALGVTIDAEIIPVGEAVWLKLAARAPEPPPVAPSEAGSQPTPSEAEVQAEAINARAAAWAYRLTDTAYRTLTPVFETLLPEPPPTATPAPVAPPRPAPRAAAAPPPTVPETQSP